jgi:ribulose-5-phosphate 4-epimerase/fuculose-1-phosphate aldolase
VTLSEARTQLQRAGLTMLEQHLTWGNAGNVSARLDDEHFLITASGTRLGELSDDDFVVCTLDGKLQNTDRRPSKEVPMHRAVYEARPDIQAVLHGAPFYSTLLACTDIDIPSRLFVESMYYLERVARVPYRHPGSDALGEAVRGPARNANVLLLEHHGVLVSDVNIDEALQAMQVLELTCRMLVTAQASGIALRTLPKEMATDFLEGAAYKPRRRWPT